MNLLNVYNSFIRGRKEKEHLLVGYSEKHHIQPRSLGGSEDPTNLVKLSAREHLFAHYLLSKIYPDSTLPFAFLAMCNFSPSRGTKITSIQYKYAKTNQEATLKKISNSLKGKFKGRKSPLSFEQHSEIGKKRIAGAIRNNPNFQSENGKKGGAKGGRIAMAKIIQNNPNFQKEQALKGGARFLVKCSVTGYISTPCGLGQYRKKRGIPSEALKERI